MKKMSEVFSKFMFWFENVFYILFMLIYEMIMMPMIFFQILWNIIRYASLQYKLPLMLFWLTAGYFYLLFGVVKDMFYFLKILCDYKDEEDLNKQKDEED